MSGRGLSRVVNGLPLRVDPVGRQTFTPTYDAGATDYLRRELREGMEAWNVGANVGVYTLQLAHWVGATGRVVAFEPNPEARAVLIRNVALNSLQPRVEIVASAVGEATGSVDFFTVGRRRHGPRRPGQPVAGRDPPHPGAGHRARSVRDRARTEAGPGRHGHRRLGDCGRCAVPARCSASTRFIVELHPDAWKWSGHTRADLEAILDEAGLDASPVSGQADPLVITGRWCCRRGQW